MEKRIAYYEDALKTLSHLQLTPVKLHIGDESFDAVEFTDPREWSESDDYFHSMGYDIPEDWLLVKTNNPQKLDEWFCGEQYDIGGEKRGDDFIFMSKSPKSKREDVEWDDEEWQEYVNKKPEFYVVKML